MVVTDVFSRITDSDDIGTNTVIASLVVVLFVSLVIVHVIKDIRKRRKDRNDESSIPIATHIVVLIHSELFVILTVTTCGLFTIAFASTQDCVILGEIWFVLFHAHRCILYFTCVRRVMITYEDTILPFNRNHKYIVYILIIIYFVIYLLTPLLILHIPYSFTFSMTIQYDDKYGCLFQYEPFLFGEVSFQYTSSLYHISMIIYVLYIFISPLRKLSKIHPDPHVSAPLYRVMTKYTILHCCSVASAIVLIILCVALPFGYNYSIIDAFVNGMVLILLHPIHNTFYKYLCCVFHAFCMMYICKTQKEPDVGSGRDCKDKADHNAVQNQPKPEQEQVIVIDKKRSERKMRQIFKEKFQKRIDNNVHKRPLDHASPYPLDDSKYDNDNEMVSAEEQSLIENEVHSPDTYNMSFLMYQHSVLSGGCTEITEIAFSQKTTRTLKLINAESDKL